MAGTNKVDESAAVFKEGFNCSQSVFWTFASELGLERETAAKIASAFGGGMARLGETCGAVSGALMTIGLARGGGRPEQKDKKEEAYEIGREFMRRFKERHGSVMCRELLGCEILTPEGFAYAKEKGLFDTLCPKLVAEAVRMLEELLPK